MNSNGDLEKALRLADLRNIVSEFYPDAGSLRRGRVKAVWRGGDGDNVVINAKSMHDFVSGETYGVWRFLTEVVGFDKTQAAEYLLGRAGLATASFQGLQTRRAKVRAAVAERREADRQAYLKWQLEAAHKLQMTGSTTGRSSYIKRKGVAEIWQTHEVASAVLPAGEAVPGLVYGSDKHGPFVQLALQDLGGRVTGYQRLYDGEMGKRFVSGSRSKGAYVQLQPKGYSSPPDSAVICEGLATGASIALACPNVLVLCALNAGNLSPVTAALRKHYGSKFNISVAADNDQYKPEYGNPGFEKANLAALLYRCKVAAPTFDDLSSKPTDFNDLLEREGRDAVQAQLAHPAQPSPAYAYAAERRRRDRKLERTGATSGQRNMPALKSLLDGVTVIRSPQGTGKTEALEPLIADYQRQGLRVMYITHRVALADDAARRLGLDVYSDDVIRTHLHLVPALACCINSLHRLCDKDGNMTAFDVVIVDESEQFVRALKGGHIANKRANLDALELVLRRAKKLVMLDADLGNLTYKLLEHVRPRERYNRVTHFYPVGEGRTMCLHERRDGVYAALAKLQEPVVVFTNSKRESEAVAAYLASLGKRGRVLNSDHTDAALIAHLDENTRGLDYLVCSPTVSTGVSLTSGHFKHVCGLFFGMVGTPEDALQSLWRVRTQASYDVWVERRAGAEWVDVDAKHGATREREAALLGRYVGHESDLYRSLVIESERAEQKAQAHYRLNFIRLAVLQGFELELLEHDPVNSGLAKKAREQAEQQHRERIAGARALGSSEAAELARKTALPFNDRLALERYRAVDFYRIAKDEDITRWLELDDRGRYRRRITRLELALGDETHIQSTVDELLEQREMRADLPALASRREFYRHVLEAVDFGPAAQLVMGGKARQLDMPRYDAEQLEPLREWVEANRSWLAGLVALPAAAKLRDNLIRYVSSWLKALGLRQKRTGKNELGVYSLELETLATACGTMNKRGTLFIEHTFLRKTVPTPPPDVDRAAAWIAELLKAGRLEAFGAQKLAIIRQKLRDGEHDWLHRLANSRAAGNVLGILR